ncbi:MAG: glycine--tRNA ligase [Candidatus Thermoplasmatota archaeon]
MDESSLLALAKRRGFFYPAFEIYGGAAGFYEYGPLGTALKRNIAERWRSLYVLGEGFAEIDSPTLTPEEIFVASGHAGEFTDFSVECRECGEAFRADHLLSDGTMAWAKDAHPSAGRPQPGMEELSDILKKHGIKCPSCGGELSPPRTVNLMFSTTIGSAGRTRIGYLRPETAQAMFFSFSNLQRYVRERMPFGVVQVGRGYRNEISPRQGLLRLREFNMMEAEVFVHPEHKDWARFPEMEGDILHLVPHEGEGAGLSAREAVDSGIIAHEALAYFLCLTRRFLLNVGIDDARLRFRQHMPTEMAHYARDCWDAEALLSQGWIELVGIADRGSYDLEQHIKHSGAQLTVFERFPEPQIVEREVIAPIHPRLGPIFKRRAKEIAEALGTADPSLIADDGSLTLHLKEERVVVPQECFERKRVKEYLSGRRIVPHVIEPSYGLDRILYAVMEHSYHEDGEYAVLRLQPIVAPIKFGVFPLLPRDGLAGIATEIDRALRAAGHATFYDDAGSIGRRYARMDEVGTPFSITVDHQSLEDGTVTVRDRDTRAQARVAASELPCLAQDLIMSGVRISELARKTQGG